jgi:ABC-type phosphate/phosphonate transport system substrate-binding protein
MIASLPMYARTSNRAAHEALWALIRDGLRTRGVAAPDDLDHDIDHIDSWDHPKLVLGQICNLPYRARFHDMVTLIGASDYGLQDCPAGHFRSAFVVRREDASKTVAAMAAGRFACNDTRSQSGYGAPQLWAQQRGFAFALHRETGSHHASINAVADHKADIAAIDAQTWWIEAAENHNADALEVIGYSDTSPGQSFITRKGQDTAPYFAAIHDAITQLAPASAQVLGLKAIVALPSGAYDLPLPPEPATKCA